MSDLEVFTLPVLEDNYIFILRDHLNQKTVVIDPTLAQTVLDFLKQKNWTLDAIWNTHHHWDHTDGNLELKEKTNCQVIGAAQDQHRIPGIDVSLNDGDHFSFAGEDVCIKDVSGHTLGHIAYHFEKSQLLFSGDVIFALGCGRLFEGTAEQMWQNFSWIRSLPMETKIYCSHEYTMDNADFSLSLPSHSAQLKTHISHLKQRLKREGKTIPTSVGEEVAYNPFMQAKTPQAFAHLRKQKDLY